MPSVVIPTTTSTQTLTGDNGASTQATFTANALEGAFWNRSGVGLRGENYASSGEAALEVDFSEAVTDVSFTVFDLDEAINGWDDQIRIEAYDPAGNPIPITWTSTSATHVEEIDGSNGVLQIEASNTTSDDQSSIVVSIAGPVGSFSVFYEDGNTMSNDSGVINVESLSFSNVVPRDGTVEGTSGNDVIDGSYTGDPDLDFIDNNDAILPGDTGNDDLIYGFGGDDSISAGAGADEAYGGSGNDTIDGGAEDDLLVGDQTTNAAGDDTLTGGTGDDTLYGDNLPNSGATAETTTFNWSGLPPLNGDDVSNGLSGTSANGDVTVSLEIQQEENFASSAMDEASLLYNYNGVNDQSSIDIAGGATGTSADALTAVLTFDAATTGYQNAVENLTFGIFDLDQFDNQFRDQVIIRAYDADGNLVPVTLSAGNTGTITTSVDGSGVGTATAGATAGNVNPDSINGFVEVSVAGPVYRIEIDYNNIDPDFGGHGIRVGDLTFDTVAIDDTSGGGNDSLEGGLGDDTIFGQTGDDTIGLSDNFGNDVISGGEDTGGGDVDVLNGDALTDDVTVVMTGPEAGTITDGVDTATFQEIEVVRTGSGEDTITLGSGDDSVVAGAGDDNVFITDDFASNDSIDGGTGTDTLHLLPNDDRNLTVNMDGGFVADGLGGAQEFENFENITTGGGDDTILGDGQDNVLISGGGNDSVSGGAGTDTIDGGAGNDTLDGGIGNDTLTGGEGADTFTSSAGDDTNFGGTGDDTFAVTDDSDTETITGGEDVGNGDTDRVDFTSPTSANGVTISYSGTEAGTYSYDGTTASGSFAEIEEIDATDFDDTIDASGATGGISVTAGTGADTITSGQGDDSFDLGDGSPDGDADQVILTDGFGSDTITGFDAPTPNGDGTFTGIDTFDVTGLTDLGGVPVNTHDVTVTDDGSGNAVLTFPNGESVTLDGISPTDADNPFYLNAIGIPLPPPDGIVTGTEGADTIDAAYTTDPEGDQVDNSDALLTGEAPEDDIIVAGGGDDSVSAGLGDDDIYGGDGSDTIDGGAGADTIYGDTPQGAWYYEYYDLDPTGDPGNLAEAGFAAGTADFEGIPTEVGYTDTLVPDTFDTEDDFALKFTTVLEVTAGGDYTFATNSNDGSKLFINGIEVVDNDGEHPPTTVTGAPITLPPGEHIIEIIYFENVGTTALSSTISGPDTGNVTTDLATYDGLRAATGDDIITGGAGDDTLFGGTGSDQFNVAEADDTDTITGGEDTGDGDTDTIDFSSVGTADGVNVSFDGDEQGSYQVGATGSDGTFTEIERIVGTDNADTVDLTADSGGITVETGTGDDVVTSGAGDDSIDTGTGQDDIVINDNFGNDTIDGGNAADGTGDVLDGSGLTQDVTVDISTPETGTVTNGSDTASFAEIEEIQTGSGNDTVTGSTGDDRVLTGGGSDTITAGDGNDSIDGGDGSDTIDGGDGNDSLIGGSGADSISGGIGNDTINGGTGFDSIAGGTGDDSIIGGDGQDTIILEDNFGNDTINAGDGGTDGDTLDGSALTEDVIVNLSASGDGTITNGSDTATFALFEEIETGSGDDTIVSNGGGASVSTGAGSDDITFGDGDTIDAGADDDTITLAGAGSGNTITIDGGDEDRDGTGALIGGGDTLALGDLADFDTINKVQAPDGSFSGSIQLLDGTTVNFTDIERIVCFTPGALIATPQGERPIETLQVGDLVVTRDHGLQPIRWIQTRTVAATGKFAPVRIRPGAITGLERDIIVSPQHRMLFTGYRAELLFGEREVLMPAIHLVDDKMVTREQSDTVTYVHMMFDSHEVVYADGAATESFHPGDEGLAAVSGPAREELFGIFPELRSNPNGYGDTARRCLKKHETQMLQV